MTRIKSWGGMAIAVAVLILSLQSTSAFDVQEGTYLRFDYADGSSQVVNNDDYDPQAFQGLADLSPTRYVEVILESGESLIVPESALNVNDPQAFESWASYIGSCTSDSNCMSLADDYCSDISSTLGAQPTTNPYIKHTYCNDGRCRADCQSISIMNECIFGRNCNDKYCAYGEVRSAECDGRTCITTICKDEVKDPNFGTYLYDHCDPDSSDKGESDAKEYCVDYWAERDPSKAVIDASCASTGKARCAVDVKEKIDCTYPKDPVCKDFANRACTYGYSSATCVTQEDCVNAVYSAHCDYTCKVNPTFTNDPVADGGDSGTTQPDNTIDSSCGNFECDPLENDINCPEDCREVTDPETGETCIQGYVGDYLCDGIDLIRNKQTVSCLVQPELIKTCEEACRDGACVPLTGDVPVCGDGTCESTVENSRDCPQDCSGGLETVCGDGECEGFETANSCKSDCGTNDVGVGTPDDLTPILWGVGIVAVLGFLLLYIRKKK